MSASFIGKVMDAAQDGGNRFSFCSVTWELGHDLVERHEYGLAARCFGRLSRFASEVADPFLVEAARTAERSALALAGGQAAGGEPREALALLHQDLVHLTREEVHAATATLAPSTEDDPLFAPSPRGSGGRGKGDRARPDVPARAKLEVRFFGDFQLIREGRVLSLGRNGKAKTILKYLLAHTPRPVPGDFLIDWLWPDSDPRRARWSLNSATYAVRRLFREAQCALPLQNLVLYEAGYYRLSPDVEVSSDVHEFEARFRSGRLLEGAGRAAEAVVEYERAAELYRDDYLTEDLYEDWTLIERERLADTYGDVLDRLARQHARNNGLREAIRACYRALRKDPYREGTYQLLMECYARLGLRDQALQQYRLSEELLKSRYGTSPSPQTQALYRSLMCDGGT